MQVLHTSVQIILNLRLKVTLQVDVTSIFCKGYDMFNVEMASNTLGAFRQLFCVTYLCLYRHCPEGQNLGNCCSHAPLSYFKVRYACSKYCGPNQVVLTWWKFVPRGGGGCNYIVFNSKTRAVQRSVTNIHISFYICQLTSESP